MSDIPQEILKLLAEEALFIRRHKASVIKCFKDTYKAKAQMVRNEINDKFKMVCPLEIVETGRRA